MRITNNTMLYGVNLVMNRLNDSCHDENINNHNQLNLKLRYNDLALSFFSAAYCISSSRKAINSKSFSANCLRDPQR